jgi:hypothetical protein
MAIEWAARHHPGTVVELSTDNTTTVALLNKQGTTCSTALLVLAKRAWTAMLRARLRVQAVYLAGILNTDADTASRLPTHDYRLSRVAFSLVQKEAPGPLSLDLFASTWSTRLQRFWTRDHDAFARTWPRTGGYAFPPPKLIPQAVERIRHSGCKWLILITPAWYTLTALASLNRMSVKPPMWIPPHLIELDVSSSRHKYHPTSAGLWCWTLSA